MKTRGIARIAMLSETGGYGKSGREQAVAVAREQDIAILLDESYDERDIDLTPQVTHAMGSNAQALFVIGTGQSAAVIARNCKQLSVSFPLYCTHGQASQEFIRIAGAASEGIRLPAPALLIADTLSPDDPQRQVCLDYKSVFEAAYKTDVSPFGGYAFDALNIALAAIARSGVADRAKLRTAIEQTRAYAGVSGVFTMSPTDHHGLDAAAFHMVEITGGTYREISKA
jgi:branched-chain amino acid transport system substrate-binding protein